MFAPQQDGLYAHRPILNMHLEYIVYALDIVELNHAIEAKWEATVSHGAPFFNGKKTHHETAMDNHGRLRRFVNNVCRVETSNVHKGTICKIHQ